MARDGEPKGVAALIQGRSSAAWLVPLICLAGCSTPRNTGPEAWWHNMSGGRIAAERPPPPGDKDPFPSLATVPPKPPRPDVGGWNRVTAGLVNDRIAARQIEALNPLPPPARRSGAQPPSAQPAAMEASLGAPEVKPPTRTQPPVTSGRAGTGQLPALPVAEPARPNIAPAPRPAAAQPPPPAPAAHPIEGTPVDFDPRSAAVREGALAIVQQIAAAHGDRGIAITGYGEASSSDPLGQQAALDLALRRAQAIATALVAEGVPNKFLRVNAEAAGRGAALRLLQ